MNTYWIYKITSPTGKVYIGQTKDVKSRMYNYEKNYVRKQKIIYSSIKKYGYENHKFKILIGNLNKEKSDIIEVILIKFYKSLGISLNITDGGYSINDLIKIPIVRFNTEGEYIDEFKSARDACKELKLGFTTLSKALKSKNGYAAGFLWLYKKDYLTGSKPNWKFKELNKIKKDIYKFTLKGEYICKYKSLSEASEDSDISKSLISSNLNGKHNKAGNFLFSTTIEAPIYNNPFKKVYQYDLNNNLIAEFNSVREASEILNLKMKTIVSRIENKRKLNNFILMYIKYEN